MLHSQHYTGYLCDNLIFIAGSGFNPVPDLVGKTLIYQYIIRLSLGYVDTIPNFVLVKINIRHYNTQIPIFSY